MSFTPRLPLFAATLTLLSLALALVFLTGHTVPAAQAQTDTTTTTTTTTAVDYDSNDDRLIEISNLAQLNAVRWDLNGDGAADATANSASYTAAFPNAAAGMGCPDGTDADTNPDPCLGYELKSDLTFDSNGDGSVTVADSGGLYWNGGAGWTPIGTRAATYTGQFQGRGQVISRLFISNSSTDAVGLFGAVSSGGRVAGVGLEQVNLASSRPAKAGSLVGINAGTITASYATGAVSVTPGSVSGDNAVAGGLVGVNIFGTVRASFAAVVVSATNSGAVAGGLVGQNAGSIQASYATGAVSVNGSNAKAGGLAGNNERTIAASYARGAVSAAGTGSAGGGLVGSTLGTGVATASYWDTTASGQTASVGGTGQTSSALQSPTGYSGIYANWNLNLDGVTGGDSPWDFVSSDHYPILVYGTLTELSSQRDYDADNDQLIEVNNLAQLNAIRWDLNADGVVAAADQANYAAAFPGAAAGMGCAQGHRAAACTGYELQRDLNFDTYGDGIAGAGDQFWNDGQGWNPIGWAFTGTFQGNGKTIANLYINRPVEDPWSYFGLFKGVGSTGVIDGVKLQDVNIRVYYDGRGSMSDIGALAGDNGGTIRGSSATGRINLVRAGTLVGGLVGRNIGNGSITGSYTNVGIAGGSTVVGGLVGYNGGSIVASSYSSGAISTGSSIAGGLVGWNSGGTITAAYSRGRVDATSNSSAQVGGLVGINTGTITASYSRSPVKATGNNARVGGLVGYNLSGAITASYAIGPVEATGSKAYVGGLVGENWRTITAAYSHSTVKATGNDAVVGGLVGYNRSYRNSATNAAYPATITASYAIGSVVATGTGPSVGGLVGKNDGVDEKGRVVKNSLGRAVDSYWDTGGSGQGSSALGTGIRGTGPTSYTGIYANWNLNLDGVAGNDDPWHFASGQYPMLKYGGLNVSDQL